MDLRKFPRFPVQFRSSFTSAHVVGGEGTLLDLSIRGCRVDSETNVQPGINLELRIHVPEHEPPIQVQLASVRWARTQEFGLEFTSIETDQRERLRQVVRDLEMGARLV